MGRVVGIDLGTTSSRVAVMQDGSPVIIKNAEGDGTTPSYIAFSSSGQLLVGKAARRQAILNHENTIYAVKRLIGRRYDDPAIESMKRVLPYKIIAAENGDAWLEVGGRRYSPVEISSMILRTLKESAEAFLRSPVSQAVVTAPAYFNDAQRQATKDAARIAGLKVIRIISEPTAAALAYGFNERKYDGGIVAIYDLGGGTFDISILEIDLRHKVFEVKSISGDTFLGGEDFDICLVDHIVRNFSAEKKVDLRDNRLALQRIKEAAEQAKIELSSSRVAEIQLPFLAADQRSMHHLKAQIDRVTFETLIRDLVRRTTDICGIALKDARLVSTEINEVILVGGSTRIPLVEQRIADYFGRSLYKGSRREDAVALGAAIQAGIMQGYVKNWLLLDVIPFSLGIETAGGMFSRIIDGNTTIPTKKALVFSTVEDNQNAISIRVFQGEHAMAAQNKLLGQFDLVGIPPAPRGVPQIEVSFDINANSLLNVQAKDKATGKAQQILMQASSGMSEDEISDAITRAPQVAERTAVPVEVSDQPSSAVTTAQSETPGAESNDEIGEAIARVLLTVERTLVSSEAAGQTSSVVAAMQSKTPSAEPDNETSAAVARGSLVAERTPVPEEPSGQASPVVATTQRETLGTESGDQVDAAVARGSLVSERTPVPEEPSGQESLVVATTRWGTPVTESGDQVGAAVASGPQVAERTPTLAEVPDQVKSAGNKRQRQYFISYAREDEAWVKRIEKSLSVLTRTGRISLWLDRNVEVGASWAGKIYEAIDSSDGVILLISAGFPRFRLYPLE